MNKVDTQPSAAPDDMTFVDAMAQYLGVLGKTVSADEFIAGLPITAEEFDPLLVPRACRRLGFVARVKHARNLADRDLPACAKMIDGQYYTVLRREGDTYVIAHPGLPNSVWHRTREQMKAEFAGEYIVAAPTIDALEERHVGVIQRGHWFWRRLTQQRLSTIEILIATLVANGLAVAVSLFALQVYDRVIPNASLQTLWVLAIGAGVAICFEALLRISRGRLIDDVGRRLEIEVSAELVSKLQGMRINDRVVGPAALGSMMREFSSVREFFTATSMGAIADIPFVGIFLLLIYFIAGPVVWVVAAAMVLIIIASLLARKKLSQISEDMQGANSAQSRLLNEITYGAEAIKLNRAENRFQSAWEDVSVLIASKTQEQRVSGATLNFLSQAIQQVAYVSAVIAGVYLVLAGEFTVGAIIAVSILSSRAIAPVTQLSGAIARWQQVKVALTGLSMIAGSEQDRSHKRQYSRRDVLRGEVDVVDLHFRYAEDQEEVLRIDRFSVRAGETVALLGRNGSGKSTLLKILSGLYDFERGEVKIDGLDLRQIDPVDLRRNMGVLSQDVMLFSGSLRDNLLLGPTTAMEEDIQEALRFSGLLTMVERHPLGMDMPVSDGGFGLSVGQRQSLGLARIHLADPQIVLLDEPTAAMDQTLEAETIANMRDWLPGRTCILTTHRTEIIALANRVGVMQRGQLALYGPRDEVLSKITKSSKGKQP